MSALGAGKSSSVAETVSIYKAQIPDRHVSYKRVKRAMDFVITATALLVLLPLFAAIAVLVKLTSPGPVIFKQVRIGKRGRRFDFFKFRSMYVDAEERKAALMHLNESDGPTFKMRKDPRITPVGRWLRKLSLDELPQLINVLKGDMSLVGPRPPLPAEVAQYTTHHLQRLCITPGVTCLWQISGRSNVSFEHWVEMDLFYADNMSFWLDLKILLLTIPAVIKGEGAY